MTDSRFWLVDCVTFMGARLAKTGVDVKLWGQVTTGMFRSTKRKEGPIGLAK